MCNAGDRRRLGPDPVGLGGSGHPCPGCGRGRIPAKGEHGSLGVQGKRTAAKTSSNPAARIKAPKGFQVELIYSVPKETQGSWVNMAVDPKGRLIVSDQYGKLYRVTPPPIGGTAEAVQVEPIDVAIGEAHGLLWAFDSLYVVVNRGRKYRQRLYRVRDTDGDDRLDKVELLRKLNGGGEHGPHAVVLAPDGKSLYVVAGNATQLTEPRRLARAQGLGRGQPAAADGRRQRLHDRREGPRRLHLPRRPDGKNWELVAIGFRNPFDIAFNRDGELFTYDSDMEWDINTPVVPADARLHVASGARVRLAQRRRQVAGVLPRQPAAGGQHRPRLAHRASPSATARSSRRSTRRRCTSATGATASSTPST